MRTLAFHVRNGISPVLGLLAGREATEETPTPRRKPRPGDWSPPSEEARVYFRRVEEESYQLAQETFRRAETRPNASGVLARMAFAVARAHGERGRAALEVIKAKHLPVLAIECASGCSTCCTTVGSKAVTIVAATIAEVALVVEVMLRRSPLLETFKGSVRRTHDVLFGGDGEDVRPCLLLDASGLCSLYVERPLICRGVTSISASDCKSGKPMKVRENDYVSALASRAGLQRALVDIGVTGELFELEGALRHVAASEMFGDDAERLLREADASWPSRIDYARES